MRLLAVAAPVLLICSLSVQPGQEWQVGSGVAVAPVAGKAADTRATPADHRDCGPGAIPETGLQGQVPIADQLSGASKAGYRCNLRLVGATDIQSRGTNFQLGWYRDCAYVGIVGNQPFQVVPGKASHPLDGVAVIDASDPARPRTVRVLRSDVGRSQHEAVEVNEQRGMLVVQIGGLEAQWIEIYDVSQDCTNPVFKARYDTGGPRYHGQRISADGNTIYASNVAGFDPKPLDVIDVSDMTKPRLIAQWGPGDESPKPGFDTIHDLDLSPDGTRAYLGAAAFHSGPAAGASMAILDTTEIRDRRPGAKAKLVSTIALPPNMGHTVQLARIAGRPHVLSSGEVTNAVSCPWQWGHIVDISAERAPRAVSEIKLEVNEQSSCSKIVPGEGLYSIHYGGLDDARDTTTAFYTWYTGGLRVFDVRDPAKPKEIAYYHPPGKDKTVLGALGATPIASGGLAAFDSRPAWDSATSDVRYRPETGQIWVVSIGQGFQILEPTGGNCSDDVAPVATFDTGRSRISRSGVRLAGRASDRGCRFAVAAQRGGVARAQVALGRELGGGRCRFLNRSGSFGPARRCSRPHFITARGTTRFSLRIKTGLPRGRYRALACAIDLAGNRTTAKRLRFAPARTGAGRG